MAARDALAKELRSDGDGDLAAEVKALRKPSVPAWAVNQLARQHAGEVNELLAAGADLRKAQRRALSGAGAAALREATAAHRTAMDRLLDRARALVTAAQLDRVSDTLRAASVSEEGPELLRSGQLTEELDPAGFGDVSGLTLVPSPPPAAEKGPRGAKAAKAAKAAKSPPGDRADLRKARQRAEDAARRLNHATEEHERLAAAMRDAEAAAAQARDEATAAARAAEQAGEVAAKAERRAGQAQKDQDSAAERLEAARSAAAEALDRLEAAEKEGS